MPVNLVAPVAADLHPIAGVRIGVAEAGVRKAHRKGLTVFLLDEGASVAGVFTQNRFCAAPVQVCRDHLAAGHGIRAMLINTGNANAGTGESGLANANARWCNVNYQTFESTAVKDVHVIGDSVLAAPAMPKSGHMANSHGKVVAAAVVA
eukprot:gene32920-55472_t